MKGTNCYTQDSEGDIVVRDDCETCPNCYVDDIFDELVCKMDVCIKQTKEDDN